MDCFAQGAMAGADFWRIVGAFAKIAMPALANGPAVVALALHQINRFPKGFRYAAYEHIAAAPTVKGQPKWIAEAPGINLAPPLGLAPEQIGAGNGVSRMTATGRIVDVDAQDFAVQAGGILGVCVKFVKFLGYLNGSYEIFLLCRKLLFLSIFGGIEIFGTPWAPPPSPTPI